MYYRNFLKNNTVDASFRVTALPLAKKPLNLVPSPHLQRFLVRTPLLEEFGKNKKLIYQDFPYSDWVWSLY